VPFLKQFCGGLAPVFPGTASVETDFSILKWEFDAICLRMPYRKCCQKEGKRHTQFDCDACHIGRATRKRFRGELGYAKNIGDVIHSDRCGEFQKSTGSHKYFVSFIDETSRSARIAFLKKNSDQTEEFKKFRNLFENENDCQMKRALGPWRRVQRIEEKSR
jgi:hypothetical protein